MEFMILARRKFIKNISIFVPTLFVCSGGAVSLSNLHPSVASWMATVKSRSGNYSGKSIVANDFMLKALVSQGLRSSIIYLTTYTGLGLNAIKAPLINDSDPTTPDSPQQLDEADFDETVGLTGNGTNEFMLVATTQTQIYNQDATNHSFTYGAYICSGTNQNGFGMGVYNGSDYIYLYISNGTGTTFFSTGISGNQISVADSAGTGFYCGSYNTTTDAKLYKRGVQIGTSATPGATYSSGFHVGVLDVNNQESLVPVAPSTKVWGGHMLGRGISAANQLLLNDIWKRTMGILGRPVI